MANIFKEIYITLVDWIKDLRSTRNQLIWTAVFLFMWSVINSVDPINLGIIAGLLTTLYYFYFKSKEAEHKHNYEKYVMQNTKVILPSRDPEED